MIPLIGTPSAFRNLVLKFVSTGDVRFPAMRGVRRPGMSPKSDEQRETQRIAMRRLRAIRRGQDASNFPPYERTFKGRRIKQ